MIRAPILPQDMDVKERALYSFAPTRIQPKLPAHYLLGLGYSRLDVVRVLGRSEGAVPNDLHAYEVWRGGDLKGLRRFNPYASSAAWSGCADTGRHAFVDQLAQTGGSRSRPSEL
jgi:hypothetical protein